MGPKHHASQRQPQVGRRRYSRVALALAPILALAACDQVVSLWRSVTNQTVQPGPIALDDVPEDARAVAFGTMPEGPEAEAARAAVLAAEPAKIVPGEVILGAKVEAAVAEVATVGTFRSFAGQLAAGDIGDLLATRPAELEPLLDAAEKRASDSAARTARTVLGRLGVADRLTVDIGRGGVVTVDLTPEMIASPTAYTGAAQDTGAAAGAAVTPAEPEAVVDDPTLRCPRSPKPEDLRANPQLLTQCAVELLTASRQFEFVEKNYVIEVGFERPPRPAPAPAPTPAPPQTAPNPAPNSPAPAPPRPSGAPEKVATGASPNDPLLALQWHLRPRSSATGAPTSAGGAGFEAYWTQTRQVGSRQVRVAVIDTGLDTLHPDIVNSPNVGAGIDVISSYDRAGDNTGVDDNAHDEGDACGANGRSSWHGTHVAGTVGAALTDKGRGVAGGAWNVTVVPVRALGRCGGELEDIIAGIRWAAGVAGVDTEDGRVLTNPNPADIINMSLSIGIPCPASMQSAINQAFARGALVVVAAGNKANPAASFAPANCNNVIVVAAGDGRGNMAFYSNFGPQIDVMAPGGDVFADADGDARPDGVLSMLRNSDPGECYDPATRLAAQTCWYGYQQGTSMAAPHVAAALALLKSANPQLSGRALETAFFQRMVTPYDSPQTATQCQVACANNPNAVQLPGIVGQCMRLCGRGMLDLTRAIGQGGR